MNRVQINGRLVPADEARVSVFDRGFLFGDGLFETMRAYGGRVFRLREHLDRLERSAARIGLRLPGGLADAVGETLAANGIAEAAVRLTVSRGPGQGLAPPERPAPTVVVSVRPAPTVPVATRAGVATGRVNEHSPTAGLKRLGYLDAILELTAARVRGYDDVVFRDTAGHAAEGAFSNLFVLASGVLRTPPCSCGILPGITRAAVMELAGDFGQVLVEEPLDPAALASAEEAFLTSSVREIVSLVELDGRAIGRGEPGPFTSRLRDAYAGLVRSGA